MLSVEPVPIQDLDLEYFRVTNRLDESVLEKLKNDLADGTEEALLHPVSGKRIGEGDRSRIAIFAGWHRVECLRRLGKPIVPVRIMKLTDAEARLKSLQENLERRTIKPMEIARRIRELKTLGMKDDEVARQLGYDISYIRNLDRLNGLPEEVQELVAEGKIPMGAARALLRLKDNEGELVRLAHEIAEDAERSREDKQWNVRKVESSVSKTAGDQSASSKLVRLLNLVKKLQKEVGEITELKGEVSKEVTNQLIVLQQSISKVAEEIE